MSYLDNTLRRERENEAAASGVLRYLRPRVSSGLRSFLHSIFEHELQETLPLADIFGRGRMMRRIADALAHPAVGKHLSNGSFLRDAVDCPYGDIDLAASSITPLLSPLLETELRIAVPPALAGSLAILCHLRCGRELPVVTDYRFSYSAEIVARLRNRTLGDSHDGCVVAFAVAAANGLLSGKGECEFVPFMLMPQTTHQVVAAGPHESWDGEYHFMTDAPGTGAVYFEELALGRRVLLKRSSVSHSEPSAVSDALTSREQARAILWFPHYRLQEYFNGCCVLDEAKDSLAHQGTVLFVHERIVRTPALANALRLAVRDSWQALAGSSNLRASAAGALVENDEYVRYLTACGGVSLPDGVFM